MHTCIYEIIMLICFGASWPFSIAKALRTRVVAGKSPLFLGLVITGYAAGICHKLANPVTNGNPIAPYIVWFYALNLLMVALDLGLYLKYKQRA